MLSPRLLLLTLLPVALATAGPGPVPARAGEGEGALELPTGKRLTPAGRQTPVSGFPCNLALSPDGRFLVVSSAGGRSGLTVLSVATGAVVSRVAVGAERPDGSGLREGLHFGLAFGGSVLYASRGAEGRVAAYRLEPDGKLTATRRLLEVPAAPGSGQPAHVAGVGVGADGLSVFAVDRTTSPATGSVGAVALLGLDRNQPATRMPVDGYPFAIAVPTLGPAAGKAVFVSSQRDGAVSSLRLDTGVARRIATGAGAGHLLLNARQDRLYVANAGADTVSVIDTNTDGVIRVIELRPEVARALPGATPLGMALAPDGTRLYVALADLNAVAVVSTANFRVLGYLPAGWYPTAVACSSDGRRLFVANGRGSGEPLRTPIPTDGAAAAASAATRLADRLEGSVSIIEVPGAATLRQLTERVLENNLLRPGLEGAGHPRFRNPGIDYVIYVLKEGRTYDQVLGDLPQGKGAPGLCAFPRAVTPNQHALAERFALLDGFRCSGDGPGDGLHWSLAALAGAFTTLEAAGAAAGHSPGGETEGRNGGVAPDLLGRPDVALPPGGFLWDRVAEERLSHRNYGVFTGLSPAEARVRGATPEDEGNQATRRNLIPVTDPNFRGTDPAFADSDAWVVHDAPTAGQRRAYGAHGARSRFAAWKREFDASVAAGRHPRLTMVRFPRSTPAAIRPGGPSARALAADTDYAIGQLVEAVSNSPFWPRTAVVVVETSTGDGVDHVDARRGICLVASPFVRRGLVDHAAYHSAGVVRTLGLLLGLRPLNHYDATAAPLAVFGERADNAEPFAAILPPRAVIAEAER